MENETGIDQNVRHRLRERRRGGGHSWPGDPSARRRSDRVRRGNKDPCACLRSACLHGLSEARPALRPSWVSGALCGDHYRPVWVDPVDSAAPTTYLRARGGARGPWDWESGSPGPPAGSWGSGRRTADATWATRTDSSVARARARSDHEARGGLCMATRRAGLLSCRDVPFAVSVAAPPARGSTLGFGWPVTPGHLPNG